ncbi:MAG: DUF3987 domain-containing protein [Croceibacterium sp.]
MSTAPAFDDGASLLDAALGYVAKGLPVFPCNPRDKTPLIKNGLLAASADKDTVSGWWVRWPDAMIGMPTGERTGFWVLDVDDPAMFEAACRFDLPVTRRCDTGKGYHLLYKWDPAKEVRNSQRHVKRGWPFAELPGAETRGEGGYVIVPPSIHPAGRTYQWHDDAGMSDAPARLYSIVRKVPANDGQPPLADSGYVSDGRDTAYGLAALEAECELIRAAGNGEQESALNEAALKIGALIAGGSVSRETARANLIDAGTDMTSFDPRSPWTPVIIERKVDRGLDDGARNPRGPKEGVISRGGAPRVRVDPETGEVLENNAGPPSHSMSAKPMDLWARYEPPALPAELLPETIAAFALKHGTVMGADPAGVAMAALTVCASIITDEITLQVKRHDPTWKESARLWVGLVGVPSAKKTPIMSAALRPARRIDSVLMRAYTERQDSFETLTPKERKEAERPRQERRIIADATVEAAQEVLKDSPRGVLSSQDELSGWFGAMDKYAPGKGSMADRAFWLQAFNGGPYSISRIARGSSYIPNCSICVLGGIQPEPLRAIASDMNDDGLIQRFLPVLLRTGDVGRDVPADRAVEDYDRLIERLELMRPPARGGLVHGDDRPQPLRFDDRARRVREQLEVSHLDLVRSLEGVSPKLAAHFGKYDGLFARLCVLWHCIEHADSMQPPVEICLPVAEKVAAFMERFLRPMAIAFYAGTLGLSAGHDDLIALASYIVAKGLDEVKARDAQSSTHSFRHMTAEQFRLLCEKLEAFGWLEKAEPGPKSNTPRWLVNPLAHELFADRARNEAIRREAARDALRDALQG